MLPAVLLGATVLSGVARAEATAPGGLYEIPLPGGITAALAALDDRVAPDRSQFLLEVIRRFYHTPVLVRTERRVLALQALLAHMDRSRQILAGPQNAAGDTVPLPLAPQIWIDVVFGGRSSPDALAADILRSRHASLLYYGLLALDDDTRTWLAGQRELLAEIVTHHPGAFVVAAPGLRVSQQTIQVPGRADAAGAWETLVGRRASEPAAFIKALLAQHDARLAYFFGAMAQLTPAQQRTALNLDAADRAARTAAARRLQATFERVANEWRVADRVFSRPVLDPALLIADVRATPDGRPILPGTRAFWTSIFGGTSDSASPDLIRSVVEGEAADFAWLAEQVFRGDAFDERRYQLVLFASRLIDTVTAGTARDAIEALRGAADYPALSAALERGHVTDLAVFAAAARQAAQISKIGDNGRFVRALGQFQGVVAMLVRSAARGSLTPAALGSAVTSLCAVPLSERGEYEGRLVTWLDAHLRTEWPAPRPQANGHNGVAAAAVDVPVEADVLRLVSGSSPTPPRIVEWEGTRYRVDFGRSEAIRIERLLEERPRPFLSAARAFAAAAEAVTAPGLSVQTLLQHATAIGEIVTALSPGTLAGWNGLLPADRFGRAAADLASADVRNAPRLAGTLRLLADDLFARGLMELAYAAALGHEDRAAISATEAAGRHEFGFREPGPGRAAVWRAPAARADRIREWRITGALLGLDVQLAEYALVPMTLKPPPHRPTLNDDDRRVLVENVVLIEPAALDDGQRDAIVAAVRRGRARLAATGTPEAAAVVADAIRLGGARRTLLPWVARHDPRRLATFLSLTELLRLGLDQTPRPADRWDAWGVPAGPRLGCLCVRLIDDRPSEALAGRWYSGIFATGFADLNLRLAELLDELKMPASILAPVLAAAALDFVSNATSRDLDDRRGLLEFVHALAIDRAEQYLALLTTDGPLVPLGESSDAGPAGIPRGEDR